MKATEKATWMRKMGWRAFALMWVPFAILMFLMGKTWFQKIVLHQYDAPNPTESALFMPLVIAVVVIALLLPVFFVGSVLVSLGARKGILARGRDAEAEILRVADTGTTVNQNPMVRMFLRVTPEPAPAGAGGTAPFETETTTVVSRLDVPRLLPGVTIRVKYLPETHEVAVVW